MTREYKRMQAARTALLLDQEFFSVLTLLLKLVEDPGCGSAWTDGVSVGFDPAWTSTLSMDELMALVAHEVMHCACGHPWRRGNRDPQRWNIAADYAVNQILVDAGFKLPPRGYFDPQYKGRWAEWIYDRIPPQPPQPGGFGANNPQGEVRDAPADAADQGVTEESWKQAAQQALSVAKARGKAPASLVRDIAETLKPIVDWRSVLRRFVQQVMRADYTWSRPNRRYLASGLYLPALHSESCGPIAVAVDTSGSIDDVTLSQFNAEIQTIADEVKPEYVDVLYCDARVHRVDRFDRDDAIVMKPAGGGGTSFRPVFDHYEQSDEQPVCLIYLTDLDGYFPESAPAYPVIWACTSKINAVPFGEVVPVQ